MQIIKDSIKTMVLSLIMLSLVAIAYAWTEPSSNPPAGNVSAPVNTSSITQYKPGALGVGGLLTSDSKILINDKTAEPGMEIFNMNTDNQDVGQRFHIGNLAWYSMGLDRSDGGKFKINYGPNVGDTNHLTIDTAGNVGIGTPTPGYKLDVAGDARARGWLRTTGNTGWYSDSYGGGWFMQDTSWIRAYNNKNVYTSGEIRAGTIRGNGSVCIGGNCRSSWPSSGDNFIVTRGTISITAEDYGGDHEGCTVQVSSSICGRTTTWRDGGEWDRTKCKDVASDHQPLFCDHTPVIYWSGATTGSVFFLR